MTIIIQVDTEYLDRMEQLHNAERYFTAASLSAYLSFSFSLHECKNCKYQ